MLHHINYRAVAAPALLLLQLFTTGVKSSPTHWRRSPDHPAQKSSQGITPFFEVYSCSNMDSGFGQPEGDLEDKVKSLVKSFTERCGVSSPNGTLLLTAELETKPPTKEDYFKGFNAKGLNFTGNDLDSAGKIIDRNFYGEVICETSDASPLSKDALAISKYMVSPDTASRILHPFLGQFENNNCSMQMIGDLPEGERCLHIAADGSARTSICNPVPSYTTSYSGVTSFLDNITFPCAFFTILPRIVMDKCEKFQRDKNGHYNNKEVLTWLHDFTASVHATGNKKA
ncbi:hypothetical protein BJ508DRAFT_303403 [Ascobolus immersus RN42]|uniref:Uncharacterized protein n=1 Tax=Ascobolus immersus RN42 TaxID=1160509 RepID=A0A3N4IFT7_ASCIM|nr:hypothetical protein BJ508DRAFT_303403 [Ascobolus immersus RN42]